MAVTPTVDMNQRAGVEFPGVGCFIVFSLEFGDMFGLGWV